MHLLRTTKYNTVDEALLEHFKAEQEKQRLIRKDRKPEDTYWSPSSMGLCKRSHYFKRMSYTENEREDRDNFVTELGNMTHEYVAQACSSCGILICSEKTIVDEETKLKGRFDNLVSLARGIAMVDVKSQRPEAFFKRAKDTEKVKPHQKVQLACYDYLANKYLPHIFPELVNPETGKVVDYSVIYYVDRGGGCRDEIPLKFDESFINKHVLGELKVLNEYFNNKTIPPAEAWGTWQCKYCNHKDTCISIRNKQKELTKASSLKTKPK